MFDSATAAQIANTGQVPAMGDNSSAIISSAGDIKPSSISLQVTIRHLKKNICFINIGVLFCMCGILAYFEFMTKYY